MADGIDLADLSDVTGRSLRALTSQELLVAGNLIPDASALLRAAVPTLDARLASGASSPNLVRGAIARMILRALESQVPVMGRIATVGGVSDQVTYGAGSAVGALQVLPADLVGIITPVSAASSMVTISTMPEGVMNPFLSYSVLGYPDLPGDYYPDGPELSPTPDQVGGLPNQDWPFFPDSDEIPLSPEWG